VNKAELNMVISVNKKCKQDPQKEKSLKNRMCKMVLPLE
jgi:hypothetical protein